MTRILESSRSGDRPKAKRSLLFPHHTAAAIARPTIDHPQLRHLLVCPQRRGIVYFICDYAIVERNLFSPQAPPRKIIEYDFKPTSLAATAVASSPNAILFAVGGQKSQIHVSLHSFSPTTSPQPTYTPPKLIWKHDATAPGEGEIVNTIVLMPTSLTDDTGRAGSEFRMGVGGNNSAVRFFDIALQPHVRDDQRLQLCGQVRLETFINHLSISPDGRTLLCAGDTPKAYLYHITPGPSLAFSHITTFTLPPPSPPPPVPLSLTTMPLANVRSLSCFSTSWSPDGLKFAIASQEGQLCVWDVRSVVPVFTFWTPFRLNSRRKSGAWGSTASNIPDDSGLDSGIRSVEFSGSKNGRELLIWVEHTINLHVIDARTFDLATHMVIPFPDLTYLMPSSPPMPPSPTAEANSPSSTRPPSPPIRPHSPSSRPRSPADPSTPLHRRSASPPRPSASSTAARWGTWTGSRSTSPSLGQQQAGSSQPPSSSATDQRQTVPPSNPLTPRQSAYLQLALNSDPPGPSSSVAASNEPRITRPRPTLEAQAAALEAQLLLPIPEELPADASRAELDRVTQEVRTWARNQRDEIRRWIAMARNNENGDQQLILQQRPVMLRALQTMLDGSDAAMDAEVQAVQAQLRRVLGLGYARRGGGGSGDGGGGGGAGGSILRLLREARPRLGGSGSGNTTTATTVGEGGPADIAGLCLDPTGEWVYVSGRNGIVEWHVRERVEVKGGGAGEWV